MLKPLLTLFDYSSIRVINLLAQVLMMVVIVFLMTKRNLSSYIIPFLLSLSFASPWIIHMSLQFSNVFYATLISSIAILCVVPNECSKSKYPIIMLICGALTSYLDLLTFPMLSLTVPLVLIWLLCTNQQSNFKELFSIIILCIITWLIGYVGMWAAKWIFACFSLGFESVFVVTSKVQYWLEVRNGSRLRSLWGILKTTLFKPKCLIAVLLYFSFLFATLTQKCLHNNKSNTFCHRTSYLLLIVAFIPVAWIIITASHASHHSFYTYRNLVGTIFAILSFCTYRFSCYEKTAANE